MSAGVLSEHDTYLRDQRRNEAYAAALAAVVREGDRVLDLGCGTGLLGLLALRAGAAHVDAVDSTTLIELAEELAVANGYADRVDHRRTWSTDLSLAEPVDLVVCDQADGVFGLECGALDTLPDARERLGTPDARVVPARLTPLVVPVRSPKLREKLDAIGRTTTGLDASAMTRRALSTIWYRDQDSVEPAGPVLEGPPIELGHRVTRPVRVEGPLDTEGCDALACAFRVELAPGVTFSNAPSGADVIDRGVPMVPLAAGARPTHVDVALHPRSGVVRWRITTADDRLDGSTLGGLLDPALLHRLDPSRRPRPTEKGALAAKLLGAADGSQAADDLRAVLPEQHRDLVDVLLSDGYLV